MSWACLHRGLTDSSLQPRFDRDSGWAVLGAAGFEPVRQVAIGEDGAVLRSRGAEFNETMTRNPAGAISSAGRAIASARR